MRGFAEDNASSLPTTVAKAGERLATRTQKRLLSVRVVGQMQNA